MSAVSQRHTSRGRIATPDGDHGRTLPLFVMASLLGTGPPPLAALTTSPVSACTLHRLPLHGCLRQIPRRFMTTATTGIGIQRYRWQISITLYLEHDNCEQGWWL